ncbi:MAG: hypothetical protein QMD85_02040, partial [Candidatus Aenigmarchaeota archaeon]|nr:hypothetical protein [Candidatus Aenigmarchaeota archaeon]MDI6722330.1 hypothetical protein [Candidatus Aenigmarchaeota archaeon]
MGKIYQHEKKEEHDIKGTLSGILVGAAILAGGWYLINSDYPGKIYKRFREVYKEKIVAEQSYQKENPKAGPASKNPAQVMALPKKTAQRKPSQKKLYSRMTQKDLDRIYPIGSAARSENIWIDNGIACDFNRDGYKDYITANTLMRSHPQDNGMVRAGGRLVKGMRFFTQPDYVRGWDGPVGEGYIEMHSDIKGQIKKIYTLGHLWNSSCDSLYVKDLRNDGDMELFVRSVSGGNRISISTIA